ESRRVYEHPRVGAVGPASSRQNVRVGPAVEPWRCESVTASGCSTGLPASPETAPRRGFGVGFYCRSNQDELTFCYLTLRDPPNTNLGIGLGLRIWEAMQNLCRVRVHVSSTCRET